MRMDPGVRFEILWNDADLFEVRVSAWNGVFGGSADVYVGIGGLVKSAHDLEGFPQNPSDKRKLQFGEFGFRSTGGAATIDFYCNDSAGHALVEVRIESDHAGRAPAQSVFLAAAVEPAAVDSFVSDLRRLEKDQRRTAFLSTSRSSA